jgi:hypothetical protein
MCGVKMRGKGAVVKSGGGSGGGVVVGKDGMGGASYLGFKRKQT